MTDHPRIRARIVPVDGIEECVFDLADRAIASGRPTGCPDCPLVTVPDVVVVEAAANGDVIAETYKLVRDDGRMVHVFRREVTA